jgi:hypothetical protein
MICIAGFCFCNDEKLGCSCKAIVFFVIEVVSEMMCDIIPTQMLVVHVWSHKS